MDLGWKVLIPVSLGWFLFLAALEVGRDRDWNLLVVLLVAVTVMAVAGALLRAAIGAAQRNRELEEVR
jgi:NADH-quinone oxidoreductase subunit H